MELEEPIVSDFLPDAYLSAKFTQRNEIIGRGIFDLFPDNPDDETADGVNNLQGSVLQRKSTHSMAFQRYDIRRPDGMFEERYWSPVNKPVFDDVGEIQYIVHRVVDVTDFIHLQQENSRKDRIRRPSGKSDKKGS